MDTGFLHLHTTSAALFLVFFLFKTVLLLANRKAFLDKVRAKTKFVEALLGTLIIVTGVYLSIKFGFLQTYLWVKIVLVVLAIPIGIIALKRYNKPLAIIALLVFVYAYGVSETNSLAFKPRKIVVRETENTAQAGMVIYRQLCVSCHGPNGNKQLFNAARLSESELTMKQKYNIIAQGKGQMPGFGRQLEDEQIMAVIEYIDGFKRME